MFLKETTQAKLSKKMAAPLMDENKINKHRYTTLYMR